MIYNGNELFFYIYVGLTVTGESPRNLVLLNDSKELQMSKPISMEAGFIGDKFFWKRTNLAKVGEKDKSKDGKSRGSKSRSPRSFVLRTHIVGRVGVKKLHID